jgi:hypothetical protein
MIANNTLYYYTIPHSHAYSNRITRSLNFQFTDNWTIDIDVHEKHTGHSARRLRLLISQVDSNEYGRYLVEELRKALPDGVTDGDLNLKIIKGEESIYLNYQLKFYGLAHRMGNHMIFRPSDFLSRIDYSFESENRKSAILFDYAHEIIDSLKISIPTGWDVEACPTDTTIFKNIGHWETEYIKNEREIFVKRRFRLKTPFGNPAEYPNIREFFKVQQDLNASSIVLKKKGIQN